MPFAELHCHTDFSFLDGASPADDLLERALELGLSALAVTDHQGLYGAVRFAAAAREAGLHAVVGMEIELIDSAAADPHGIVLPPRRRRRAVPPSSAGSSAGEPARPPVPRQRPPGQRDPRREDLRGVRPRELGPHLTLLAQDQAGYASLCRLASAAHLAGTKGVPQFSHERLAQHRDGLIVLTGCRHGELPRRLLAGDREGATRALQQLEAIVADGGLYVELQHHLLPDDDWLTAELARLAHEAGLPTVVTNDVHYALRSDRELQDVLVAIRHGQTLEAAAHLRRPNAEYAVKSGPQLAALPPGTDPDPLVRHAWLDGIKRSGEIAQRCQVSLEFERYRFPGFPVPGGETAFSHLERLCHDGVRRRYHPITPRVLTQMAHELDVIERTGLAEFFLICWDIMRFSRERGIPAQGRGSAGDSIVAYALGITRVDPIRHELLFERFINEGRTTYPDVDIDFASSRREEVIAYVYERYGAEHTGMVCNVVTYRARSAVREVGYALGFPRPLVDRVAKALETYDSVMVRRDLEADGGFAEFFAEPVEEGEGMRQLLDEMGELRRPTPATDLRPGPTDDEGGPGDTPASEHFLRHESARRLALASLLQASSGPAGPEPEPEPERRIHASSVGAVELDPLPPRRRGSTIGLSPWDRWLELCARIDGRPRHLSIHVGGMLVTRAPLVDIAPLEHATMPGRVVVQFDKRDIETMKLIKLDLLGLRMLSAIDDALRDIKADCAVHLDLDRLPEDIGEVFRMICAADTVGVFQIESRAQMQTLPKSRPQTLDDLVVEVAIIRPGPIQGDAVHPYLRRRGGIEPVTYLHPALEPILAETLGVILYQEQVMKIAIDVAGFSAADSDGFRRAMGTWRSQREMEKLHARFVDGCIHTSGLAPEVAEELFGKVAGFASFGFNKSHAAAFARTAYESAFLKLFYPAQFVTGLINAQPMGFYPVEVLINDAKRHGVAVLPVDINASRYRTASEWVGLPGTPLPEASGIDRRPDVVRSSAVVVPDAEARDRFAAPSARGYGIRLGLHLLKGIGEAEGERMDAARESGGPFRSLADLVARTELSEEVVERLIRAGAADSLGQPRREALWQLREIAGATRGRGGGRAHGSAAAQARPLDIRLPPTPAPTLPPPSELERLGDAYAILSLDARRQVMELYRPALAQLGALSLGALADRQPGRVAIGGLVVTRQHPMTARGTVFLALEDETGMVNVTLWPRVWGRLRGVVRRHALLYVEGDLQVESGTVNLVARQVRPLVEVCRAHGGPGQPDGVRQLGHAGMRRLG
ncbi:MAG TPA: PHP domain-containing protein [Anaerolineae bacterium]|nr:PHP domain-containing protein [Anaerolineae bacterium]